MSGRRKAREVVLQACYAYELSGNSPEQIIEMIILSAEDLAPMTDFAVDLFKQTIQNRVAFDDTIVERTANWEFDRIAIIDKIVLRMVLCEFLHFPDIPPKVSIDEGIEVAKKFSTEQSGRFVNGIADAILNSLRKDGKLQKTGRGLVEG